MSSPYYTTNTLLGSFLSLVATGITFLALGFALWFAFLAAEAASVFIQYSRHMHQPTYRPLSFLGTGIGVAIGYGMVFFTAAVFVARMRWHYHAGVSAFVAYSAFLAINLPSLDWSRGFSSEVVSLIIPLVSAPLGGLLGERLFAKTKIA